jgi:plasmid maintenance system antidote protein VapI
MRYLLHMKTYSTAHLVGILETKVKSKSQRKVAGDVGFSPQFVNDVMNGRRPVTEGLATRLGFRKVPDRWVRIPQPAAPKKGDSNGN